MSDSPYRGPQGKPRDKRERERDRQARERGAAPIGAPSYAAADVGHYQQPVPAAVTRFDVPFVRLVFFFMKAAIAAIPALLLLGAMLWGIGHLIQKFFPHLVKMQILIWFPN